jgi:hypothetical protein
MCVSRNESMPILILPFSAETLIETSGAWRSEQGRWWRCNWLCGACVRVREARRVHVLCVTSLKGGVIESGSSHAAM